VYRRGQFDAIVAPTLLLTGSESVPVVTKATELAAAAIRAAEIRVLQGQAHLAHKADTGVAKIIGRFIAL
jgi:pimeloyl-ACP methyl ester carboxylesterase